jgi:flagellar motor switch protein FliG
MGAIDGFQNALEALQALDENSRNRILADIAKLNPQLAERLKEGLFSFADLQYMLPSDFKVVWWEIPKATWYLALRKSPPGVMKMIERHLSKRAFQDFQEQLTSHGPQPISKVIQAQKEICDIIRTLAAEGKMASPSGGKGDPLV